MTSSIRLVVGDEFALAARGIHPFAHRAKAEHRIAVGLRARRQRYRVGLEPRDDRRIVGVRDAEAPEQQRAAGAMIAAARRPELHDALDVAARLRRQSLPRIAAEIGRASWRGRE